MSLPAERVPLFARSDLERSQPCAAEPDVQEVAGEVRRLYHATLLAGRALAAFAPRLGEVDERAELVRIVFSLVSQSEMLHRRLLELRTDRSGVGAPAGESVQIVQHLLDRDDGLHAPAFGRTPLRCLAVRYTALLHRCGGEANYHDRLVLQGCLGRVREGAEPYLPHPRDPVSLPSNPPAPGDVTSVEAYLSCLPQDGPTATVTGTVALRVKPAPCAAIRDGRVSSTRRRSTSATRDAATRIGRWRQRRRCGARRIRHCCPLWTRRP